MRTPTHSQRTRMCGAPGQSYSPRTAPSLQALRVRRLLAIASFVRIVSAQIVVLAALDPCPPRGPNRPAGHRLTITPYLRRAVPLDLAPIPVPERPLQG